MDFTTDLGCRITASRAADGLTIIWLEVTDGKFKRRASFALSDEEREHFASKLLELT